MKRDSSAAKAFTNVLIPVWLVLWAAAGHAELVDRIVAIVNDDVITLSELDEALEPYAGQIRDSVPGPKEEHEMLHKLRQDILNTLIDQKLTDQESRRLGVSVPESEVDQKIEQIRGAELLTEEELVKALQGQGYTLEEYRNRIKEQILRIKLINIEVKSKIAITEQEIRDYYEEHKEAYQEITKYHLRTILIRVPSSATVDEIGHALKRMEVVVKKFKAGTPFEELAKQYSEDTTAKEGGDLGLFHLEELSTEFQETVRGMKEGEISPILQTPPGYQVVMLQQIRRLPGKALRESSIEIQEKLYSQLVEEKYNAWLNALRERSYIEIIQ